MPNQFKWRPKRYWKVFMKQHLKKPKKNHTILHTYKNVHRKCRKKSRDQKTYHSTIFNVVFASQISRFTPIDQNAMCKIDTTTKEPLLVVWKESFLFLSIIIIGEKVVLIAHIQKKRSDTEKPLTRLSNHFEDFCFWLFGL